MSSETQAVSEVPDDYFRRFNGAVWSMDPVVATSDASEAVVRKLFDTLLHHPNGELEIELQLAREFSVSEDFRTYRFKLEEGIPFHDDSYGTVTADDVVYSFERVAASPNSRQADFVTDALAVKHDTDDDGEYVPGSLAVEAVDDHTVTVELERAFHSAEDIFAHSALAILPEGLVDDVPGYDGDVDQETFAEQPVGTGPFQFESWSRDRPHGGDEIRVARFDDYHGDGPSIGGISWLAGLSGSKRYELLLDGEVDMSGIPNVEYDAEKVTIARTDEDGCDYGRYGPLENGETLNYAAILPLTTSYIGFNTQNVPKPIREAVAYAINQHRVLDEVFSGRRALSYHLTPPPLFPDGLNAATEHSKCEYPYGYNESRLAEARERVADAGYDGNNPYILRFTTHTSQDRERLSDYLSELLPQINVEVKSELIGTHEMLNKASAGEVEMYFHGWVADWPAADNFLQLLDPDHSNTDLDDPVSYTDWRDTSAANRAERAWDQIQRSSAPTDRDEKDRHRAYLEMEEANWEDVAILPLYHYVTESIWYDEVEVPSAGPLDISRQQHTEVRLSDERIE